MNILISAGPTREYFDTVRFISNPSSGRMGYALASVAFSRGHEVTLVSGPVDLPSPEGVRVMKVTSAEQMYTACANVFEDSDAAIMTAAVCDYRPAERLSHKLKKDGKMRRVELEPTRDILAELSARRGHRLVIGFAMEDHDAVHHAELKLRRKGCDGIVLNGLANVGSLEAEIQILLPEGWLPPVSGSKAWVARHILECVEARFRQRQAESSSQA